MPTGPSPITGGSSEVSPVARLGRTTGDGREPWAINGWAALRESRKGSSAQAIGKSLPTSGQPPETKRS